MDVRCVDSRLPPAERGFVIQGVPVGHPEYIAAWLAANVSSQRDFMERLATYVPDTFSAAQLLTQCVTPRIGHILRALPPPVSVPFATLFDTACEECFTAIACPDFVAAGLPPIARAKTQLKLRDGGLDVATQARTAPAAYAASWAATHSLVVDSRQCHCTSLA